MDAFTQAPSLDPSARAEVVVAGAARVPWAHVDICGPAQNNAERPWQPTGCTGFGARLLLQTVLDFRRP